MALHSLAHNFIELCKPHHHDNAVIHEVTILWPPDANNWLIEKDPDAGGKWRWKEKGMAEDEMVR